MFSPTPSPATPSTINTSTVAKGGIFYLGFSRAVRAVRVCLRANVPCAIIGRPGIGKSALMHEVARLEGFELFDYRLSDKEPGDVGGLPFLRDGRLEYAAPKGLPYESSVHLETSGQKSGNEPPPSDLKPEVEAIEKPKRKPPLILWDEFDRADEDVHNVTLQLLFDRSCNGHTLPNDCRQVLAMNADTDAGTTPLSSAAASRMCHIYLDADAPDTLASYLSYAQGAGISEATRAFARFKSRVWSGSDAWNANKAGRAPTPLSFPCPRAFDAADRVLTAGFDAHFAGDFNTDDILLPLMAGCVGEKAGTEFLEWHRNLRALPSVDAILSDPANASIPSKPAQLATLDGILMDFLTQRSLSTKEDAVKQLTEMEKVATYVGRWPEEPQSKFMKGLAEKSPLFAQSDCFNKWKTRLQSAAALANQRAASGRLASGDSDSEEFWGIDPDPVGPRVRRPILGRPVGTSYSPSGRQLSYSEALRILESMPSLPPDMRQGIRTLSSHDVIRLATELVDRARGPR